MSWSILRSRSVCTSACSLHCARSLCACSSVAPFLVQVTLWEKNEQPASKTEAETARTQQDTLAAAAVDRRVIIETPDLKAYFAVTCPEPARRATWPSGSPAAIGVRMPRKSAMNKAAHPNDAPLPDPIPADL